MTFNFLGPGLTVNVEAKVKEQIILDSSVWVQNLKEDPDQCF
jgi:flagellar assembly factor FliW